MPDYLKLSQQLLSFNTVNPPGNEKACMDFFANWLQKHGFNVEKYPFGENRCNLIATIQGKVEGKQLAFAGHLDTVPLGDAKWQFDPFGSDIANGKLYGRGASDMKSAVAIFACACIAEMDSIKQGTGITLIITGGEETGCEGAKFLCEQVTLPDIGAVVIGESTHNYPIIGHKGALWLKAEAIGVTAHGAMPEEGINAIYKVANALQKIQLFEVGDTHPLMKFPTLNVGTIQGGLNINSVPDYATFTVDIRTAPNLNNADIFNRLQRHLGEDVTLSRLIDLSAVLSDESLPWIQSVYQICESYFPEIKAKIVSYFTDASVLLPAIGNPPCLILGPGDPNIVHKTDEYCELDMMALSYELYKKIILKQNNL